MNLRALLLSVIMLGSWSLSMGIQANVSHSVFYKKHKQDSTKLVPNILLSWRAQNKTLHFIKNQKGELSAELICLIRISTDTSILIDEVFNIKTPPITTSSYNQIIEDQYEYLAKPGHYEIEVVLYEQDYKNELFQFSDTLTIKTETENEPFLSSIQLLDTFFKSEAKTIYSRNNNIDLPLSSNFLGEKKNTINYYYELYFANKTSRSNFPLKINTYLSWKPLESTMPGYDFVDSIFNPQMQIGVYRTIPIENLKSGNYYVNTILMDKNNTILDKECKFFQRFNNRPDSLFKPTTKKSDTAIVDETKSSAHILDLTTTFVGKYNGNQVRAILKMLLLICDQNEGVSINGFLRKPDELYSKYFIYNFWEKRDKTAPEKAWKAYAEKIKEVNRLFKGSGLNGFETDRGKVYIQYGKPNDRIIVNNETNALPYEIWQYYNTEKQGTEGVFLFYKPGKSLGDYQLLHSTLMGEKRNNNWRALLYNNNITGSGNLSTDSQAEQYLRNK
jgi:GWxTD domain-containing protein